MTDISNHTTKTRILSKILFPEDQLVSLDHYLPETYDYLMHELDVQKRMLAELDVQIHFSQIDSNDNFDRTTST